MHKRIIIDLIDVQPLDGVTEARLEEALLALADVCGVQVEDGVFEGGTPDTGEHVADFARFTVCVEDVDLDLASSGSSQHYIETGRYLTKAEHAEANPTEEV